MSLPRPFPEENGVVMLGLGVREERGKTRARDFFGLQKEKVWRKVRERQGRCVWLEVRSQSASGRAGLGWVRCGAAGWQAGKKAGRVLGSEF